MLKYLTLIAPLLVKAPRKNPVQVLTGFMAFGTLIALGSLAVLIGIWTVISLRFNAPDIAWLTVGALMLLGALFVFMGLKSPVKEPERVPVDIKTDPLGELLPDELLKDPIVAKVLQGIDEYPMGSVAAAAAAGAVIGKEVFGPPERVVVKA